MKDRRVFWVPRPRRDFQGLHLTGLKMSTLHRLNFNPFPQQPLKPSQNSLTPEPPKGSLPLPRTRKNSPPPTEPSPPKNPRISLLPLSPTGAFPFPPPIGAPLSQSPQPWAGPSPGETGPRVLPVCFLRAPRAWSRVMCPGACAPRTPPIQALLMPGKPPNLYLFLFLLLPPLVVESRAEFERWQLRYQQQGKCLPRGLPEQQRFPPHPGQGTPGDTCQMNPD